MTGTNGYAVFFFPQALEALGEPIRPYLHGEGDCAHVKCRSIDTGGSLIELTLDRHPSQDEPVELELMVPASMVRMIVSARSDEEFGFGPRFPATGDAAAEAEAAAALPPAGPSAAPAAAPPRAVPGADGQAPAEPTSTPAMP